VNDRSMFRPLKRFLGVKRDKGSDRPLAVLDESPRSMTREALEYWSIRADLRTSKAGNILRTLTGLVGSSLLIEKQRSMRYVDRASIPRSI